MTGVPQLVSATRCFGGTQARYRHSSAVLGCEMVFSLFLPPQAVDQSVPAAYWLSGLTCTDENFVHKAGAQRVAAELGIALVVPDTSPRGPGVADDPEGAYDFGLGAGFYLDASREPYARHYRMGDYVAAELPALIEAHFPIDGRRAVFGHSMGGHGALVTALRHPGRYRSVSAFAPITNPMACPWGEKAFTGYLGEDRALWRPWDACALIEGAAERLPLLVDQGTADAFLETQLRPQALEAACKAAGHPLTLRLRQGYDHSYFFIASFIEDHLRFHARALAD
ncbi:S-formylglutathione hydrolase [Rhodospirillum rubrum]|uniref:S-formylglutathione hydrolase n=1 Tax=Rhodospirillum rubrum TaxID=1085 RepID=UPI001904AB1E|nr:S-formylglutathione hydrolase [Rhodospirillum rubrum]MBK1665394.1 S-formylglutathione hydrolase [Rhodospirillum rubrum]MBK1677284.1 S-formylglutathione hydrolase [Rhodospirillum rubrum]